MIVLGLAFGAIALPACFLSKKSTTDGTGGAGGDAATTASSTSTSSGKGCDAQSSCDACTMCAAKDACADELAACQGNSSCVGLDECLGLCGSTPDCRAQCESSNLPGVSDYNRAITCLYCQACPTACAGSANCK